MTHETLKSETPPHVLVVDDSAWTLRMLQHCFKEAGFNVALAENAFDALRFLNSRSFDAALLDDGLPDMSGRQLAGLIRTHPRARRLPIVMLTGKAFELDATALRRSLGIHRVLSKPFSPRHVIATVSDAMLHSAAVA